MVEYVITSLLSTKKADFRQVITKIDAEEAKKAKHFHSLKIHRNS